MKGWGGILGFLTQLFVDSEGLGGGICFFLTQLFVDREGLGGYFVFFNSVVC